MKRYWCPRCNKEFDLKVRLEDHVCRYPSTQPNYSMPINDILGIIQKEIEFHELERGNSGKVSSWESGFIDGLRHIHKIIKYGEGE